MTLQSKSKITCITRLVLASMFLAAAWVSASAQTNTFPSTGNAGVGTTIPTYKLQVSGYGGTVGDSVLITDSNSTTTALDIENTSSGARKWRLQSVGSGVAGRVGNFEFVEIASNLKALVIQPGGNVGIGTTSPHTRFDIKQSSDSFVGGLHLRRASTNDTWALVTGDNNSLYMGYANNASGADAASDFTVYPLVLTGSGRVGVGTASPAQKFHVLESSNNMFAAQLEQTNVTASNGLYIKTQTTNSGDAALHVTSNNGSTQLISARNNGYVGIGTAGPGYKLDVQGGQINSSGGLCIAGDCKTAWSQVGGGGGGTITGVTAGSGLTGGGTTGSVTLNVGAGTGITVAADTVSVNYGSIAGTAVEGNKSITVSAGSGMSDGGALTLGSGGTVTLTNADKGSSQNIFKNVANSAGTTQFSAGSNNDAIRFAGSGGTSVTFDAATKKITIDGSTSTISAANIAAGQFGQNTGGGNYTFPGNVTVNGNLAAKYQDLAEWVPSSEQLASGTVVVLDTTRSNQVISSTQSYDTRVAGVISAQPGITLGEEGEGKVLVATTGRVRVKVDASRGAIQIGDLLVTSDVPGLAMKSEPVEFAGRRMHMPGTIIGKALEPLAKGSGEILVLLSLQ